MNLFQELASYLFRWDYVLLKLELGNTKAYRVKSDKFGRKYILFVDEIVFLDDRPDWILKFIPLTFEIDSEWDRGLKELVSEKSDT